MLHSVLNRVVSRQCSHCVKTFSFSKLFSAAQEVFKRPLTEFPSVEVVHRRLQEIDINC